MIKRLLFFITALLLFPAHAMANDLEGTWALRIGEATIFTFEISRDEAGEWQGLWTRPAEFASNGVVFAQMTGSEEVEAMAAIEFAQTVELSFDDPRPNAVPDIFNFRLVSENQAQMTYVGTQFDPYPMIRVAPGTPLGPFDNSIIYDRDNAVTEADYVEPVEPPEPVEEPTDAGAEQCPGDDGCASSGPAEEEESESPRITADFLDGLDD